MTPSIICLIALGLCIAILITVIVAKGGEENDVSDRIDVMRANITTLSREIMNLELRLCGRIDADDRMDVIDDRLETLEEESRDLGIRLRNYDSVPPRIAALEAKQSRGWVDTTEAKQPKGKKTPKA